jgi:hypothetical protein
MKALAYLRGKGIFLTLFLVVIIALQVTNLVRQEKAPIRFAQEYIPINAAICQGQALHYENTLIVQERAPIVYIRSIARGHVSNEDEKHPTVQTDTNPQFFNVWSAQERTNTVTFTPTVTLAPGPYTLIVSASGLNSDRTGTAMYALEFTVNAC